MCGYPDADNTGVPPGTVLTVTSGDVVVNTPATIIDSRDIRGCVIANAANVTVRRSKVACSTWHAVSSVGGGLLVEDSELSCMGTRHGGVDGAGYTARRLDVSGCENGFPAHDNVTIEDSWVHDLVPTSVAGAHSDAAQLFGGTNITLRHNTMIVPGANAAITRHISGFTPSVLIENNFLGGGTYTVYCPFGGGMFAVIGNRFADGLEDFGLSLDCDNSGVPWSGNYRDSNGTAVNP